jgi:hypothetical protein
MENNESVEPESTENYSENNVNTAREFTESDLTDVIKASLLNDTEQEATSEAENTEETPEVESEGVEDNEVLSQSEEDMIIESEEDNSEEYDRGLPKGVKKRIDKLAAKRREAEQRAKELEAEVERLRQEAEKPVQIQPNKKNPYSKLKSVEQIQAEVEKAKQIRRWCEMNPEGGVVRDSKGNEREYSAEDVRNIKVNALDALDEHLPKQMQYIQYAANVEKEVSREYPWWKDRSSAERQIAEAFLQHFPEITRFPDYKMVLGDYIRGVKSREQSKGSSQQRPPSQPKSGSAYAGAAGRKPVRLSNPSDNDELANIIASRFI